MNIEKLDKIVNESIESAKGGNRSRCRELEIEGEQIIRQALSASANADLEDLKLPKSMRIRLRMLQVIGQDNSFEES